MEALVTKTALCMPFPIRSHFMAQIVVPRDMTAAEAERLCVFVRTLAEPPAMPTKDE